MEIQTTTTIRPLTPTSTDRPRLSEKSVERPLVTTHSPRSSERVTYLKHVPARVERTGDLERTIEPAEVYRLPARVSVRNGNTGQYLSPAYVEEAPLTPRKVNPSNYAVVEKTPYNPSQPVTYANDRPVVYYERPSRYVEEQPTYYVDNSPTYVEQPTYYVDNSPRYVEQPTYYTNNSPRYSQQPTYYTNNSPRYVEEQPVYVQPQRQQPTFVQQPVYSQKPVYYQNGDTRPPAYDNGSNVYYSPKKPYSTHYIPSTDIDSDPIYYRPSNTYV